MKDRYSLPWRVSRLRKWLIAILVRALIASGVFPAAFAPAESVEDRIQACVAALSQEIKRGFRAADFPDELRRAGVEGLVSVRLTVSRSGVVSRASLAQSSGSAALDDAALRLVERLFPPSSAAPADCLLNTEFDITLPLRFYLRGSSASH